MLSWLLSTLDLIVESEKTPEAAKAEQESILEAAGRLLKKAVEFIPDLIVSDIMMPKMSGYEVCEKLRELYLPNELPIVMVTAKTGIRDIVEGLETGANDYLTKPFCHEELISRVQTHLNLKFIREALQVENQKKNELFVS